MPKRLYVSVARAKATAEKREQVLRAATRFLREEVSITAFSLDAIARAAKVTRLTLYNQFGSRRGLLEAAFDEIAARGGLARLDDAMTHPDPWKGLEMLVQIFCDFWGGDPAIARLHDAMALDEEFATAVIERNERRRPLIENLVARIASSARICIAQRDAVDLIFALTSCATFQTLSRQRDVIAVGALLVDAVKGTVTRLLAQEANRPTL